MRPRRNGNRWTAAESAAVRQGEEVWARYEDVGSFPSSAAVRSLDSPGVVAGAVRRLLGGSAAGEDDPGAAVAGDVHAEQVPKHARVFRPDLPVAGHHLRLGSGPAGDLLPDGPAPDEAGTRARFRLRVPEAGIRLRQTGKGPAAGARAGRPDWYPVAGPLRRRPRLRHYNGDHSKRLGLLLVDSARPGPVRHAPRGRGGSHRSGLPSGQVRQVRLVPAAGHFCQLHAAG